MSLQAENYKLVTRQYLYRLLDQLNEDCDCFNCKYCIRLKTIKSKLKKKTGLEVLIKVLSGGELVRHRQL